MNYNKLFLISISLIYSANTFSNTAGLPPKEGNSVESNQETNDSDNNLNSKKKKYVERTVHSFMKNPRSTKSIRFGEIENYVKEIQIIGDPTGIQYSVAAPIFDEMKALFPKNSDSTAPKAKDSSTLNINEYSLEEQRIMLSYLSEERRKIIDLSEKTEITFAKGDLERLQLVINELMDKIKKNIDNGNDGSIKITIDRNDKIQEPLPDFMLKKTPANLHDITETIMSFDGDLSHLSDRVNQTATDLADTKTELAELNETVKQHEEDIEEQRKDITQVKQTADENKKHVDKYLVNSFTVNGKSRSLTNHLSDLYLKNESNSLAISSLRNDFEHFKDETNNRFYKVEKRANQGIASVAAMSNLPFNDAAIFSTAMGIGNYRNATAFAWGMQYRINENVKVKASTAWNDANNWVSAGGIGISW
ncbi:YadA-like family protein [Proteus mirabilis]|uniref:YadA-like family protein n=1 Tax=Proteus mirabilis TaxID=584 RepID=UPI003FD86925